jgi:DNA replicative helicase MCM subunit Mcm2 (Cdc46/Mcm family)
MYHFLYTLHGTKNSPTATDMVDASPDYIAENAMRLAISGNGVLDIPTMKKYIQYCKATCSPRLTEESSQLLSSSYVSIRDDVRKRLKNASSDHGSHDQGASNHPAIPITVRQLVRFICFLLITFYLSTNLLSTNRRKLWCV